MAALVIMGEEQAVLMVAALVVRGELVEMVHHGAAVAEQEASMIPRSLVATMVETASEAQSLSDTRSQQHLALRQSLPSPPVIQPCQLRLPHRHHKAVSQ